MGPQPEMPLEEPPVEKSPQEEEMILGSVEDKKLNKIFEMMGEGKNGKRNESIG